jgi:molybdopterin molybdotransferase
MLSLQEALAQLLALAEPVQEKLSIDTIEADGRVLACDQVSGMNVPPMDNTQMDGYALNIDDLKPGRAFEVSQRIPAGHLARALERGPSLVCLPAPSSLKVPMRWSCKNKFKLKAIKYSSCINRNVVNGFAAAGEDIRAGARILEKGERLTPQALGLAASVGLAKLQVYRRVRVGCFFTGDELAMPGEPLRPGSIYNSNRFVLVNMLRRLGCEVEDLGIIADKLEQTRAALRDAARSLRFDRNFGWYVSWGRGSRQTGC